MWLKEQNKQLTSPPVNFNTPQGTIMNFDKNPQKLLEYGWTQWTSQQIQQWHQQHPQPVHQQYVSQEFKAACIQFRQICQQIGAAIGDPGFKGGFDEMQEFASSPVYGTIQGLKLGLAWSAANEACQHQAAKLGIYTPGDATWWRMCWQTQAQS